MFDRLRSRTSFANAVSLVALFVALGGTSYAAVNLPNNSVGSKQIKNNGVRSADVKNGSLRAGDFRAGDLPAGPQGLQGLQGPKGDQGIQGKTGVVGKITVQREDAALPDNATVGVEATCPAGTTIIGGGATVAASGSDDIHLTVNRPKRSDTDLPVDGETFDTWRAVYRNPAGGTGASTARVFAVCAEVPAP